MLIRPDGIGGYTEFFLWPAGELREVAVSGKAQSLQAVVEHQTGSVHRPGIYGHGVGSVSTEPDQ